MKNLIFTYNNKLLNHVEQQKIKTRLSLTYNRQQPWYVITDLIPDDTKLIKQTDYLDFLQNTLTEFQKDLVVWCKNKNVSLIGTRLNKDVYKLLDSIDINGTCLNCSKTVDMFEKNLIKLIESYKDIGNVFIIIDDIHVRITRSTKYGLPSKINQYLKITKDFEVIRPIKKEII